MLQDAGLEVHERNLVMTALKNDFSFERVAQELRNQWPEHDLKTNHHGSRGSAWSLEDVDDENGKGGVDDALADLSMLAQDGMTDEGLMLMEAAEETAQEALALMDRGRRTLREARSRPGVLIVVFGFCCVGFFLFSFCLLKGHSQIGGMQVFGHLDLSRSLVMRSSRQFELARVP